MNESDRWEQGSEFHLLTGKTDADVKTPWGKRGMLYGSGRDAMRAVLLHGMAKLGWKRLWFPSFFCQEVLRSLIATGIDIKNYPYCPIDSKPGFVTDKVRIGDVLLRMNYFGQSSRMLQDDAEKTTIAIIEDHSHDPFSPCAYQSKADWCIASLRKTLPVPDGGVLWSPTKQRMPHEAPITEERAKGSLEKFTAMVLKGLYIEGNSVDKEGFRGLSISGESHIASGEISAMPVWTRNLMRCLPIDEWRKQKIKNHSAFTKVLSGIEWVRVLGHDKDGVAPFAAILLFDKEARRERVRSKLIENRVYPAVHWPMDEPALPNVPREHIELSHKIMTVHCDMRYSTTDMEKVASLIITYGN